MSVTDPYLDAYDSLDRFVCEDVPDFDPEHEPPTVVDLPDVERRLRHIRSLTDRLREFERVAHDDRERIAAWLEDVGGVLAREIEWHQSAIERWLRAHVREGGAKTVTLPSGQVQLRQGRHRIEPLAKEPGEQVPERYVRLSRTWDKQAIAKDTAPGPLADSTAPEGYAAHHAVTADGEVVPDVVRLVPTEAQFALKVGTQEPF